jgi:hypothetical protein
MFIQQQFHVRCRYASPNEGGGLLQRPDVVRGQYLRAVAEVARQVSLMPSAQRAPYFGPALLRAVEEGKRLDAQDACLLHGHPHRLETERA